MPKVVHIALKVEDLDKATKFYEDVFGFTQVSTGYRNGHYSRHMTDGSLTFTLMKYDNEDAPEATLAGPGACIHHYGIEVDDRAGMAERIRVAGGEILSKPDARALKYRAPDGTIGEIVLAGTFDA
jgi:lactoylglutathione lyase